MLVACLGVHLLRYQRRAPDHREGSYWFHQPDGASHGLLTQWEST